MSKYPDALHRGDHRAGHFAAVRGDDRRGHVLGVGVDGVSEQRQLHDGDADDHGEGEAVAPELEKFLEDDAPPPRKGKTVKRTHVPVPASVGGLFHLVDENILEARIHLFHAEDGAGRRRAERAFQQIPVPPAHVKHRAEQDGLFHAGELLQRPGQAGEVPAVDRPRDQTLGRDHLLRRALRQQTAVGDIRQLMTTLRLVHVMGAHQHGDAGGGKPVEFFPEIPPRPRVDARRRLVQQQQLRIVQHAGGQGQPLLPAAGKRSGQLIRPLRQAKPFQGPIHRLETIGHAVHAGHEIQILADGQIIPVGELLGHIADMALDLRAVAPDVIAQAGPAARVGLEQAAHHADGGGFPAAVRAEEPEDFAAPHLQGNILHDVLVAEMFVQLR